MRDKITNAMKSAMKSKEEVELSTLRLMNAAIKAKDIDHRGETGNEDGISDEQIIEILSKMVKQRRESAESYAKAKRKDLAERELLEIEIVQRFLPKQLSDQEVDEAIAAEIEAAEATSLKDIGKVMSGLKSKYAGRLDFSAVSSIVKQKLGG